MKAILNNATYTKSIFYKLKFNLNKEREKTLEEGYDFYKTTISIPMMTEDPHDVYNSIHTGNYCTLKDVKFASYDALLHKKYKQFYNNQVYNNVDVFQTWWGYYEMRHVDFNQCYIQNTDIDVYFFKIQFNDTTIENVNFKNMNFEHCQMTHTISPM